MRGAGILRLGRMHAIHRHFQMAQRIARAPNQANQDDEMAQQEQNDELAFFLAMEDDFFDF